MNTLAEYTEKFKIVPLIPTVTAQQTLEDATSFKDAGYPFLEIVCRAPDAVEIVGKTIRALPDMMIGAGTVLSVETAEAVIKEGAKFLVSPAYDPVILEVARRHNVPLVPGVCTSSEIAIALRNGCIYQKLFPANLGGVQYVEAIGSPFGHTGVRLIASCGITKENYIPYLKHPMVAAVIPDWLSVVRGKELRENIIETKKLIEAI